MLRLLKFVGVLIVLNCVLSGCESGPHTNSANQQQTPAPVAEKPVLAGVIRYVSLYPVPNNRKDLAVSMVVSVKNEGAPTTVRAWTLAVSGPGQSLPSGLEAVHVSGVVDLPGSQSGKVDLDKEDLVQKSANLVLTKGNQIDGVLTFILPDTTEKDLANRGVQLTVHFKDASGTAYQTPKSIVGAKN
jgi:hypothetical protein